MSARRRLRPVCVLARRTATTVVTALGIALALAATGPSEAARPRVIHVTAKRFEYNPSVIHVRAGENVMLEIESLDRKHGFSIPDLHVRADVDPGQTARVELPGLAAGIYAFGCDVFCGSHHEEMAGALVVE